jgi:hypothetical protein
LVINDYHPAKAKLSVVLTERRRKAIDATLQDELAVTGRADREVVFAGLPEARAGVKAPASLDRRAFRGRMRP